jgi:hypothetical protein
VAAHTDGLQELRLQHAAELESERLRLAEEAERAKTAALDDVAAQFESERDLTVDSHSRMVLEAAGVHENAMQALRSHHAAELESERLRVAEVAERDKKVALDDATARFAS